MRRRRNADGRRRPERKRSGENIMIRTVTVAIALLLSAAGAAQSQQILQTGPIWNNGDANAKCPAVCASVGAPWSGQWWTTQPGVASVCICGGGTGAPPAESASSACQVGPEGPCGGCAISCTGGQQASCKSGFAPSGENRCVVRAKCVCE
ncbi:mannan-binding lectin [Roseiarcus sp.]|uniref:mannan-binding lectin n=1 Tax=Roseiarcus sp. TaxID=1969460 RepID=UPI003F9DC293